MRVVPQGKEARDAEVNETALSPDGSTWLLASGDQRRSAKRARWRLH